MNQLKPEKSIPFNLDFGNDIVLSCFFSCFLFIGLYFLIPVVIMQIFNPFAELVVPIGIPAKEAKANMETHPVIVEIKISECSI